MIKGLFKLTLLLSVSLSLFSCATNSEDYEMLDSSLRSYERAIRWGEFTRAKSFHKANPILNDLERRRLKFYRITDYQVIRQEVPDAHNALLFVDIKYYKSDRPAIKTISVKQVWKRDKGTKIWYLDSSFPQFR